MALAARNQKKLARFGGRCTVEQKTVVKQAAELCGNSVTDFTINALMEKATEVIKQHHMIKLSLKDQTAFAEALLNPPAPSKALLNAKQRHQKSVRT